MPTSKAVAPRRLGRGMVVLGPCNTDADHLRKRSPRSNPSSSSTPEVDAWNFLGLCEFRRYDYRKFPAKLATRRKTCPGPRSPRLRGSNNTIWLFLGG